MMVLIGSQALKMQFADFTRPSVDVDLIATMEDFQKWVELNKQYVRACYPISGKKYIVAHQRDGKKTMIEFEIAWPGSTGHSIHGLCLLGWQSGAVAVHSGYLGDSNVAADHVLVAPASVCLMLKMSHRYLRNNPHFLKTMRDIQWLRQKEGMSSVLLKILADREKETYVYKHPNLKQNKMGFFDASVKYVYDHDTIHKAVAHLGKPAYEFYKSDNAEVFCDRNLFFGVDETIRLYGVLEEAYVLALERSQIPFEGKVEPKRSFLMALEKVCTSITSGFFREYAWENYDKILSLYKESGEDHYVKLFKKGLETGIIKPQGKTHGNEEHSQLSAT